MSVLVYEPPATVTIDELENEMVRAFECLRRAVVEGDAVVVSLSDEHVQGVGDPAEAALAHGLLGLGRALAVEGRKSGWQITILSSTSEVEPAERQRWIDHLSEPCSGSGILIRLGGAHLGRVPT
jgi:hypothetical protein